MLWAAQVLWLPGCAAPLLQRRVDPSNAGEIAREVASGRLAAADKTDFAMGLQLLRARPGALRGQTVADIVSAARAYRVGLKLVATERARKAALDRRMSAVLGLEPVAVRRRERFVEFTVRLTNRSARAIAQAEADVEIRDAADHRLGLGALTIEANLPTHAKREIAARMPYERFGEDGRLVRRIRPARARFEIRRIRFARAAWVGGSMPEK